MENINKQRLYTLIASAVGVVSSFMPWAKVSLMGFSQSAAGVSTFWGWILLAAYAVAGVLAFMGDRSQAMDKMKRALTLVIGAGGVVLSVIYMIYLFSENLVSPAFGLYLSLLSGLALVAIYFVVKGDGSIDVKNIEKPTDLINTLKGNDSDGEVIEDNE